MVPELPAPPLFFLLSLSLRSSSASGFFSPWRSVLCEWSCFRGTLSEPDFEELGLAADELDAVDERFLREESFGVFSALEGGSFALGMLQ